MLNPSGAIRFQTQRPTAPVRALLGEIRQAGELSDRSLTWVIKNAARLGEDQLYRLMAACEAADASAAAFSTGGALIHPPQTH